MCSSYDELLYVGRLLPNVDLQTTTAKRQKLPTSLDRKVLHHGAKIKEKDDLLYVLREAT